MTDHAEVIREALTDYMPHSADCPSEWAGNQPSCTCEVAVTFAALAALTAEVEDGLEVERQANTEIARLTAEVKGLRRRSQDRAYLAELRAWGNAMRDAAESMYDAMRDATGESITEWDTDIVCAHGRGLKCLIAEVERYREALANLLEDTQHADHPDCRRGPCPVADARAALTPPQEDE